MESFAGVIKRWGTVSAFAADLGIPEPTAYSWHQRNSIPVSHFRAVERAAEVRGFSDVTATLLLDLAARKRRAPHRAEAA
jgi:hypothetical protein